ncbi:MAG: hypothetical protein OEV06_11945, partial [Anaerolineae bacterium]|nr:hypothetical protein [Anaerolineae bacterium]
MEYPQSIKPRILRTYLITTLIFIVFTACQIFSSFSRQPNLNRIISSLSRSFSIPNLIILGIFLSGTIFLAAVILAFRREGNTSRAILRLVDRAVGNNLVSVLLSIVFLLLLLSTFAILESPPHIFDRAIPKNT